MKLPGKRKCVEFLSKSLRCFVCKCQVIYTPDLWNSSIRTKKMFLWVFWMFVSWTWWVWSWDIRQTPVISLSHWLTEQRLCNDFFLHFALSTFFADYHPSCPQYSLSLFQQLLTKHWLQARTVLGPRWKTGKKKNRLRAQPCMLLRLSRRVQNVTVQRVWHILSKEMMSELRHWHSSKGKRARKKAWPDPGARTASVSCSVG